MDLERVVEFDYRLQVFTFGFIQDAYNLIKMCREFGLSMDDFLDYVEYKKCEAQKTEKELYDSYVNRQKLIEEKSPKCPKCGTTLQYEGYTNCQQKVIISGIKGAIICSNEDCFYWNHTDMSQEDYFESIGIIPKNRKRV